MANTVLGTGLRVTQWDDKFFTEYLRESRFKPYMGTDESSVIQMKEDLTKKPGDRISIHLVNRLTNAGVTGTSTLEGNEEGMDTRSMLITVNKLRNAVRLPEMEEVKSAIDLREAARVTLKDWMMEQDRDQIITALGSINGTAYGSASEANKDAWLADNSDRVLFGAAVSNNSSNDHSASLANVDTTNDKCTGANLSVLKRLAKQATPKIRPIRINGDEEWYVVFMNHLCFRDYFANVKSDLSGAMPRAKDHPIFVGANLIYDGLIIREMPEIASLGAVGNSSAAVSPVYLCGAQAVGYALAKRTKTIAKQFDYDDKYGVAVEIIRGIEKITFGSGTADTDDLKDHGVATGYFAAAAD